LAAARRVKRGERVVARSLEVQRQRRRLRVGCRPSTLRPPLPLVAGLAATALLLGACGGGHPHPVAAQETALGHGAASRFNILLQGGSPTPFLPAGASPFAGSPFGSSLDPSSVNGNDLADNLLHQLNDQAAAQSDLEAAQAYKAQVSPLVAAARAADAAKRLAIHDANQANKAAARRAQLAYYAAKQAARQAARQAAKAAPTTSTSAPTG